MKFRATFLVLACLAIAPLAARADYVDGFGDAVDTFGVGGPILDIDTLSIQFDSTTLYFEMVFHTPISAGSQFSDNSVVGAIEFDTDQSDETGTFPLQNNFAPPFAGLNGVGVDFLLSIDDSGSPGSGFLIDANLNFINSVDIEFGLNSLSGQIALSDLGGDDGLLNFTTTIGTVPQPTDATDSVGTSTPVSAIPEPSSLALMMSVGAFSLVRRRR